MNRIDPAFRPDPTLVCYPIGAYSYREPDSTATFNVISPA